MGKNGKKKKIKEVMQGKKAWKKDGITTITML